MFALAGQIPAPVLADLVGISTGKAAAWAKLAARDWSDYVANRAAAAEAHPGDGASREPAGDLDYRLCCMPRTMRISRTPSSTWAVPSATKPCLR